MVTWDWEEQHIVRSASQYACVSTYHSSFQIWKADALMFLPLPGRQISTQLLYGSAAPPWLSPQKPTPYLRAAHEMMALHTANRNVSDEDEKEPKQPVIIQRDKHQISGISSSYQQISKLNGATDMRTGTQQVVDRWRRRIDWQSNSVRFSATSVQGKPRQRGDRRDQLINQPRAGASSSSPRRVPPCGPFPRSCCVKKESKRLHQRIN